MPLVHEKMRASVSADHATFSFLSTTPPQRSTTMAPRCQTHSPAPSSPRRLKFSSKVARTGSKPGETVPWTVL